MLLQHVGGLFFQFGDRWNPISFIFIFDDAFSFCLLDTLNVFNQHHKHAEVPAMGFTGGFRYSMEHWIYRMLALAAEIWQLQLLLQGSGMFVVSMVAVYCISY